MDKNFNNNLLISPASPNLCKSVMIGAAKTK